MSTHKVLAAEQRRGVPALVIVPRAVVEIFVEIIVEIIVEIFVEIFEPDARCQISNRFGITLKSPGN